MGSSLNALAVTVDLFGLQFWVRDGSRVWGFRYLMNVLGLRAPGLGFKGSEGSPLFTGQGLSHQGFTIGLAAGN